MLFLDKTKTEKEKMVEEFIKTHQHEAVQGSDKWLLDRQSIIGGSEISTIMKCNSFSTIDGLVAQKVGLDSFSGNEATRWGNLFENMSEAFFKTLYSAKLYSTGSIPHKTIKAHRYSPDGLSVLNFSTGGKMQPRIILLEFKSPYKSVPAKSVPKHYAPQVKAGLCTIEIAEVGLFINNMFRKCSLEQLDFTLNYDNAYHCDKEIKLKDVVEPIANGCVLFYIPKDKMVLFTAAIDKLKNKKRAVSTNSEKSDDDTGADNDSDISLESVDLSDSAESFVVLKNSDAEKDFIDNAGSDSEPDDDADEVYMTNILYKINNVIKSQDITSNLIDFGKEISQLFDQFLELYKPADNVESFIEAHFVKPQIYKNIAQPQFTKTLVIPDEFRHLTNSSNLEKICKKYNFKKVIDKFVDSCAKKGDIPIGYLPWKLLRSSNILVEKSPDFLENIKEKIYDTVKIVKEISECKTKNEKLEKLEIYFPGNSFSKNYYEEKRFRDEMYQDLKDLVES